ncbi:uncharacterized protein G2W53_017586 [Senna tora]|uniref:Uncharacterized protein n=1 Tax=Senna tora TaxID=362788 RepID=A0A834TS69_9FABA|nr:uncharacterized protein G2W53_017586 [Senna tora]
MTEPPNRIFPTLQLPRSMDDDIQLGKPKSSTYSLIGIGVNPDTLTQAPTQLSLEEERLVLQVLHDGMARINAKLNKLASSSAMSSVNKPGAPTKARR